MKENISLFKKIEEVIICIEQDNVKTYEEDLIDQNFSWKFIITGGLLDISSKYCEECLRFKEIFLEHVGDLKNILVFPENYRGNEKKINETIKDFMNHFKKNHDKVKEISENDYSLYNYYNYKLLYEKNCNSKVFNTIVKFDLEIFYDYFDWLERVFCFNDGENREMREEYIRFINKFFNQNTVTTVSDEYIWAMKNIINTFNEIRHNFIRGIEKERKYYLIDDLGLSVKANLNILKEKTSNSMNFLLPREMVKNEKNNFNANLITLFFLKKEEKFYDIESIDEEYIELAKKLDELDNLFKSNPSSAVAIFIGKYSDEIMMETGQNEDTRSEEELKNETLRSSILIIQFLYLLFLYIYIKLERIELGGILLLILILPLIILLIIKSFRKDFDIKPCIIFSIYTILHVFYMTKDYTR